MKPENKAKLANELRRQLETHRTMFVIDKRLFEGLMGRYIAVEQEKALLKENQLTKLVTAGALRIMLDYCENEYPMTFIAYCAAMFHAREPKEDETVFDLLPDARDRLDADRLGLGHIYGGR